MTTDSYENRQEINLLYLSFVLEQLRLSILAHNERMSGKEAIDRSQIASEIESRLQELRATMVIPPNLELLCNVFGLSDFERGLIVLCAGIELDATFKALFAAAHNDPSQTFPTFSIGMAILPNPRWSALAPSAPLRKWRLIEVGATANLAYSPLRISECILHYLVGITYMDARLSDFVQNIEAKDMLVASHQALAHAITAVWSQSDNQDVPVMQLSGQDSLSRQNIAVSACAALGFRLMGMHLHTLPSDISMLKSLLQLWERDAILNLSALLLECDDTYIEDPAREALIGVVIDNVSSLLIISSGKHQATAGRTVLKIDIEKPTFAEQLTLWRALLSKADLYVQKEDIEALVSQFNLNPALIHAAFADVEAALPVIERADEAAKQPLDVGAALWNACQARSRTRLDELAQRIVPIATWDDLILPEQQHRTLRDIVLHVRHRHTVYETWGFSRLNMRGLGIAVLLTGSSGTGKTLAAEVLANELRLDLYRIDLSLIISKYIGETEKNLARVFEAAETSGAILLFDEADALFGKRSEVKDSHDRYANIEMSYLLQRMEAYRGLAILTTNLKDALDKAFLRRIRFVIDFPFPDADQRAAIWARMFPPHAPKQGLDMTKLARLNIMGGTIRNIAMAAAFLAADKNEPIQMQHLLYAAQSEYRKLGRALIEDETKDWYA
jgi:AAA+ superfamily predicted ATPase